jgi:hypothetical protein
VVGNGGLLRMYRHGELIDSHDAVIRFNDATTQGEFAKFAGSKTTIRLVNSQHRGQGLTLVHVSAQLERCVWDRGCA